MWSKSARNAAARAIRTTSLDENSATTVATLALLVVWSFGEPSEPVGVTSCTSTSGGGAAIGPPPRKYGPPLPLVLDRVAIIVFAPAASPLSSFAQPQK